MKLKLLFAISETAAKTGDFRRHFIISQFADALRKKGVDCKIIDDLEDIQISHLLIINFSFS